MAHRIITQVVFSGARIIGRAVSESYRQAAASQKFAAANQKDGGGSTFTASNITMEEACKILNVGPSKMGQIDLEFVSERFKRLFDLNDPKKGGSFYLQSKILRARERIEREVQGFQQMSEREAELKGGFKPKWTKEENTFQTFHLSSDYVSAKRSPKRRAPPARPPPPHSLADRVTFGGDNRSSNQNGGKSAGHETFSFSNGQSGPQFPPAGPAGAQERARRKPNRGGAAGRYNDRNPRRGGDSQPYHGRNGSAPRRGKFKKEAPHERALLQSRDDTTEQSFVKRGSNKFNLDNLSEQDSDMDLESDDAAAEGGRPKVARTQSNGRADGDSVPKWCNPEPYTSLPPPETGKRVDVVKLIRKAKNDATQQANGTNAVAANDDFISFGADDDHDDIVEAPLNHLPAPAVMSTAAVGGSAKRSADDAGHSQISQPHGRKRVHEEPDAEAVSDLAKEWLPTRRNPVPWANNSGNERLKDDPLKWLHNEILDFYDYVVPTENEHKVRLELIERVSKAMGRKQQGWGPASIQCFGSFPNGLYLPAADMDLVYISDSLLRGGRQAFLTSTTKLRKIGLALHQQGIAGDVNVIGGARVPIIKFVDYVTGIPVDISFENRGGVDAQHYFLKWKTDYPDMVYLVALVKQFLLMRKCNEVSDGGIGGFSIICLVVNLLMRIEKPDNIGELFLTFLDFYGNQFNLQRQRLIMQPPFIVRKDYIDIDGRKDGQYIRLSIQDPGLATNNISGGSRYAKGIFRMFSQAHSLLHDRMEAIKNGTYSGNSILEPIFGGNYKIYEDLRARLSQIYEEFFQHGYSHALGSYSMPIDVDDSEYGHKQIRGSSSKPIEID